MKLISWGILGAGDVCEVKSSPAFNKMEGSVLTAVMRRSAALAKDFALRHGVPKWYSDADTLINDPDINAIYIATPPHVHSYYAKKAAEAGKIIYVEKPMANSYAECLEMIDVCTKNKVPLFIAYYRRALPNFIAVKKYLDDGTIGNVRFVEIKVHKSLKNDLAYSRNNTENWRTDPGISGGGYFNDLACHQLDIMDWLFGPIKSAKGIAINQAGLYKADDLVLGQFQFESGIAGQGSWCFTTSENAESEMTTIYGSKGTLRFPFFGDHSVILHLDGRQPEKQVFDIPQHIQLPLIQSIVDELRGIGTCPSTGITAARTNKIMEMILS
jgi:predicted dehydrogenase